LFLGRQHGLRRGLAGVLVLVMVFAMIFTAGVGYLLFQSESSLTQYQSNLKAGATHAGAQQEDLAFTAAPEKPDNNFLVTVNNTGALPLSVVSIFLKDHTGTVVFKPITLGQPGTTAQGPLNLDVGGVARFTITGYNFTWGTWYYLSLVTSRGNIFTNQAPTSATIFVSTIYTSTATTITIPTGGGGNSLVVTMVATPVQAYGGTTLTDNVTVYNYSPHTMQAASLLPSVPSFNVTGTVGLTPLGCTGPFTPPGQQPDPSGNITGWNGLGLAPHVYFLCAYKTASGQVGGLVSFSGLAAATQNSTAIKSSAVTSNLVQVGSLPNVLTQGAFTSNFFFFGYTSCTNSVYPCTTKPGAIPPGNPVTLPDASVLSGGSNSYVAFYLEITNNFNTSIPILQNTFEQFDASTCNGCVGVGISESDWWIAGTNDTMVNQAYYPNYNPGASSTHLPALQAYPSDCNVVNSKNVPTDDHCIYVNPGQSVIITLAACGPSSSSWDWGGTQYGTKFDSGHSGCVSTVPNIAPGGMASAGTTVISYWYNGIDVTQDIAFQGVAFVP
jgi:hypothetical protein